MAMCRKPGCPAQGVPGSAYCAKHKGTAGVVLPITPMRVKVMDQLEWDRMEATMQTRARTVSAPPPVARATVAPTPRLATTASPAVLEQEKNKDRMRVSYAAQLAARRTDPQLLLPLMKAFAAVKAAPRFEHYMNEEIGWKSFNSWFCWLGRTLAPAMLVRPIAEEVRDTLRRKALLAGVADKAFADRYFFELSLYCDAVILKQDIDFIFGQASLVLGPLLAPVYAAVQAAVPVVGKGAKTGAEALAKKGIKKAVVGEPTFATIPANAKPEDPMRFTVAWLDFVTTETEPAEAIATIVAEFGGPRGCAALCEWLKGANL
jgi:hypothetical protein